MTTRLVTVSMDDRLKVVKEIFERLNIHHIVVVNEGLLAGILSDRDYYRAVSHRILLGNASDKDMATLNKRVHQIMTRDVLTLPPSATIFEAVELFNRHTISCIPVIDRACRPVGIISWRDIMQALAKIKQKASPSDSQ